MLCSVHRVSIECRALYYVTVLMRERAVFNKLGILGFLVQSMSLKILQLRREIKYFWRTSGLKIKVYCPKKARTGSPIIPTLQERVRTNPCEPPESQHWF